MRIERPDCESVLVIRAYGAPATAGSKVSGVAYRKGPDGPVPIEKNGKIVTFTKDSAGERGESWRGVVAMVGEARRTDAGLEILTGPLFVEMTFLRARSPSHYGTGRNAGVLKDSAPLYPATRPDCLKHARLVEDALTGVVWADDSRIVSGANEKVYAGSHESEGVEVRIWRLPVTVRDAQARSSESLALL